MWHFEYPYTNFHELNLDWIIKKVQENEKRIASISSENDPSSCPVSVKSYGAKGDGVTDDTEAIFRCLANEKYVIFPAGSYIISGNVSIPSGRVILFENAIINIAENIVGFSCYNGNAQMIGNAKIIGGNNSTFVRMVDSEKYLFDGAFEYEGFGNGAVYNGYKAENITVSGEHYTRNSPIIVFNCCNNIDISGVKANYITAIGNCAINIVTDENDFAFKNVHVHNNYIDNNKNKISACINISRLDPVTKLVFNPDGKAWLACDNINVHDNACLNGADPCDGLDILYCTNVRISNNYIKNCFEGIAILSDNVTCAGNVCVDNESCGIALGDYTLGKNGTFFAAIALSNNIILGNGKGTGQYAINAGVGMVQPESCYITSAYMTGNIIAGSKYGIDASANEGGSNICLTGNFLTGSTAPIHAPDGFNSQIYSANSPGLTPKGFLTPPTISTTNAVNNYGCNVVVILTNGAEDQELYINDIVSTVIKAGAVTTFILPPNGRMRVGKSGTGAYMSWFGI